MNVNVLVMLDCCDSVIAAADQNDGPPSSIFGFFCTFVLKRGTFSFTVSSFAWWRSAKSRVVAGLFRMVYLS